jgi:hypothetical protein
MFAYACRRLRERRMSDGHQLDRSDRSIPPGDRDFVKVDPGLTDLGQRRQIERVERRARERDTRRQTP